MLAGGFHHPGCAVARCPVCGDQMIMCGCRFDEDGSYDDDDVLGRYDYDVVLDLLDRCDERRSG